VTVGGLSLRATENAKVMIINCWHTQLACINFLVQVCYRNKYCLAMGNKRLSYKVSFKLKVVQYAEKYDKRSAGCKFDVNKHCNWKWCKRKERLKNVTRSKWAFCCKQTAFPQIENYLYVYVMYMRKPGYTVSTEMLQSKNLTWHENSTFL
jgi:hypothetical protein